LDLRLVTEILVNDEIKIKQSFVAQKNSSSVFAKNQFLQANFNYS